MDTLRLGTLTLVSALSIGCNSVLGLTTDSIVGCDPSTGIGECAGDSSVGDVADGAGGIDSAIDSRGGIDTAKGGDTAGSIDTGTAEAPDTASGSDTGGGVDSRGGMDTASGGDAPSCLIPDGGAPCDPGAVRCSGPTCDTATQVCCASSSSPGSCLPNGSSCSTYSLHCDEPSDCSAGQICCLVIHSMSSAEATCETSCSSVVLCHTDAACGTGGTCIVQTCFGNKIEACSRIVGCS